VQNHNPEVEEEEERCGLFIEPRSLYYSPMTIKTQYINDEEISSSLPPFPKQTKFPVETVKFLINSIFS